VGGVLQAARHEGFLHAVVTTAPQVTRYLVEHSTYALPDPFLERIIGAALEVRATQPERSGRILTAQPRQRVLGEPGLQDHPERVMPAASARCTFICGDDAARARKQSATPCADHGVPSPRPAFPRKQHGPATNGQGKASEPAAT